MRCENRAMHVCGWHVCVCYETVSFLYNSIYTLLKNLKIIIIITESVNKLIPPLRLQNDSPNEWKHLI